MPSVKPIDGWGFAETIDGELAPEFGFEIIEAAVDFGRGITGWKAVALDGKYRGSRLRLVPRHTEWDGVVVLTVYADDPSSDPLYSGLAQTTHLPCDWKSPYNHERAMSQLATKARDNRPKVAFFAGGDPLDPGFWSGTPYHALEALREVADVVYVERKPFPLWWNPLARGVRKLSGRRVDLRMIRIAQRIASAPARRRLLASGADSFVSIAASGMASMLPGAVRQIVISDATSKAMIGYYGEFTGLLPTLRKQFVAMEYEAMRKAAVLSFPSQWACDSAAQDFDGLAEKTVMIPWGPNIAIPSDVAPRILADGTLRLLFVGLDWERKGGEIALETARLLHDQGFACQLDVVGVGAERAKGMIPPNATFHGRLYQSDPEQAARLAGLFDAAHVFLLPTRAEALGMVFAESAGLGIPAVGYATGGVPTVVRHGETGLLLDLGRGAADFAHAIRTLASDPAQYRAMSEAALAHSRETLNWSAWAKAIAPLL